MWSKLIEAIKRLIRPAYTFSLLYWDFQYFSPDVLPWSENQETTLFVLNLLILGFWFGERFFQNALPVVLPMLEGVFRARNGESKA